MIDIYSNENKPKVREAHTTYVLTYPHRIDGRETPYRLWLNVEDSGYTEIDSRYSYWQGTRWEDLSHSNRMEVYSFLIEWGILRWQRIGPEDSELFTTEEFDVQHGRKPDSDGEFSIRVGNHQRDH